MKRDLVITALLTFCLTASIFMVANTNSAEYDPWVDLNGDGKIDIFDVVGMTSRYAAAGDPTKSVNVTNWPTNKLAYSNSTLIPADSYVYSPWIPVDEYSKFSICVTNSATTDIFEVDARHSGGMGAWPVEFQNNLPSIFVKTYDVPNEEIRVLFWNGDAGPRNYAVDIYLIR